MATEKILSEEELVKNIADRAEKLESSSQSILERLNSISNKKGKVTDGEIKMISGVLSLLLSAIPAAFSGIADLFGRYLHLNSNFNGLSSSIDKLFKYVFYLVLIFTFKDVVAKLLIDYVSYLSGLWGNISDDAKFAAAIIPVTIILGMILESIRRKILNSLRVRPN